MRMRMQITTLAPFILLLHLTTHLCTSQSIGRRINQFDPQWHCNVDSFEFTRTDRNDCDKAIDSNDNTFWHSKYTPADSPLPHRITIDMGRVYNTRSMTYLPRQDGDSNGNIGTWRISLSLDDGEETQRSLNGSWKDDANRKTVDFLLATPARYLRLDALTEAGGRGPWSSAAQIDIYEDNGSDDRNPPSRPATLSSVPRVPKLHDGDEDIYGIHDSHGDCDNESIDTDELTINTGNLAWGKHQRRNGGGLE
ncbi:MAG: hypothetical protein Q9207_004485 [Kuettlingeria erythrocarpa]